MFTRFPVPVRPHVAAVLAMVVFAALAGCSQKSKLERHLANARKHEAAGNLSAAEIEYTNVQRLDPQSPDAMAGLAAIYLEQGSVVAALPRLSAAKHMAPDNLDNRNRLARAFLSLGGAKEARAEAAFVLDRRPNDADALQIMAESAMTPEEIAETRSRVTADNAPANVALGILALREKNLAEARTHAERALTLDPKLATAHTLMATILLAEHNPDAAGKALEQAASLAPARSPQRIAYARYLFSRRDTEGGRRVLEAIHREAPDYVPASLMRAELSAATGSPDEALKILKDVIARDPNNPDALTLRASVHLTKGENQTAIEQLEALVAKFPSAAPMHYMLARAYSAAGDAQRSLASVGRTLQFAPEHTDAAVLQAALQIQTGDTGAAIIGLRELLRKQPSNARTRILLADALKARGQPEEALKIYAEAIAASPDDPMLRFFAGTLFAQLGQTAKARQAFEQAYALRPKLTVAVERLVALDLAQDDAATAMNRAAQHVAANPEMPDAHVLVAKVAVAQKDTARAEMSLRKAIEVNPDHPVAYSLLAQLYLDSNRQDEALANLETAATKNPRDVSSLMLIGILRQQKSEPDAAREAYVRLLQVNPGFVPALNNLAYLYSEDLGDLDKAYELSNKARELRPTDPVALDTFGWILFQKREYAWALSVLNDSASKLPDSAEVQYHLGMARYVMGDEAGARTALSSAVNSTQDFKGKDRARTSLQILDTDPDLADEAAVAMLQRQIEKAGDDPIAQSRLAAVYSGRGEYDKARDVYESIVKAHPDNAIALVNLARFLAGRSDTLPRAFELAKDAYKLAPENVTVLHAVGRIAYLSGDHPWSASLLSTAARRVPDSAAIQRDLAEAAYAVGRVDDAVAAMNTALQAEPDSARASEDRVFVDLVTASSRPALNTGTAETAAATLARNSRHVPALMISALVKEQQNNTASALATYERALSIFPKFAPALKRRAILLARENPPTQPALEAAAKAREALPNDPEVAGALGTIHFRKAEYQRAATLLSEASRSPAAVAETHALLGLAQRQLGERDRSRASLQRAIDLGLGGALADEVRAALAEK